MGKKIVFFDLDGTLLNSKKQITGATKAALQQLRDNDISPVLATGRPPVLFKRICKELDLYDYVSTNGQYVQFNNKVVYENKFNSEVLDVLVQDALSNDHYFAFYNHETFKANNVNHHYVIDSFNSFHDELPQLDETFHMHNSVHQGILFCEEHDEQYYIDKYPHFDFIRWHPYALDVLPKGGSKASGILHLVEELNITLENTYAFGDGLNDVAMFELVGNTVAMANAHSNLKELATFVTASCDDEGIYKGLKHYKLVD